MVLFKYSKLSDQEKEEYQTLLLDAAIAKDKANYQSKMKASAIEDYSKSFGGTANDTKNEKDAAEILRGGEGGSAGGNTGANEDSNTALLQPPNMLHMSEHFVLRKAGKWCKYLSKTGCYLYLHNLTKDMVAVRPDDFIDEDDNLADSMKGESTLIDPANGLPKVAFEDLPAEIHRIITELNKTPLLIDTSTTEVVRTFYTYKACLEDVSCLTIPFGKSGLKKEEVMERCRKKLVSAMKTGKLFVLYLGQTNIEHADFKTKLCKKDVFPKEVFQQGGLKLLQPDYDPKYKYIYREEDMEAGQAVVRDGFQAAVITTLSAFDYERLLADSIPLGYMYPIYIVSNS